MTAFPSLSCEVTMLNNIPPRPAPSNGALVRLNETLYLALSRLVRAYEGDVLASPDLPVIMSWETNGGAVREARNALALVEGRS